ncbi:hypothetical protein FNQ90_03320 [Streptomyces alkaliphilus]|uniref:Uncharacterized protein n=1 Tax=Streptomyces alkaliphilus TaxID=1472722 RepID=A0A7W3TAC0_9ACTN|nr:hypothetical protein [Streptomyces alkaliphilus]MBB0243166.1 hypothetical protein [Streptomyces alkaliphilus]
MAKKSPMFTAIAAAVFGAVVTLGAVPAAQAAGSSARLNNCWSTWGSTGTAAHCVNTSVTGDYRNEAHCGGIDYNRASGWYRIAKGSTVDPWGRLECAWSIRSSDLAFRY